MTSPDRPLEHVTILDLSTVVAGPYGTEILGHLGARVIRVVPPGEAVVSFGNAGKADDPEAIGYWALDRNKLSICIDLKHKEGLEVFYDLVRKVDVVFDNFRPGVLGRLGIDYATLAAINPRIISCSITGFGPVGPWASVAAYDIVEQALSGSMAITGTGDGVPYRWGVPVGDIAGAMYAVIGLLAALEDRDRTGRGQSVDISLLDCQLALHTYRVPSHFGSDVGFSVPSPRRGGAGSVPYGPFRGGDGDWVVIGVASNFWRRFCEALELPELADDPRFRTLELRQENQDLLDEMLERQFLKYPALTWEKRLMDKGVPVAKVRNIREALEQPQARARGALLSFAQPNGGEVKVVANPIKFAGEPDFPQRAPSAPGADTAAVLSELLDYAPERIESLRAAEAIKGAPGQ